MNNVSELPVDRFGWVEKSSQFNEEFIKNYEEVINILRIYKSLYINKIG